MIEASRAHPFWPDSSCLITVAPTLLQMLQSFLNLLQTRLVERSYI
ncbi:hypothetical protein PVAP13_5KG160307 [Panicum virgatum]|uniref:Uncharacterized protein n=1 Tax=Panicum virgatum TaxID=38727 RepID=A0A8T0SHL3_PANVG|nr:hypothetical protein PVAP13_5KG160307 [Panicum virgatum]